VLALPKAVILPRVASLALLAAMITMLVPQMDAMMSLDAGIPPLIVTMIILARLTLVMLELVVHTPVTNALNLMLATLSPVFI